MRQMFPDSKTWSDLNNKQVDQGEDHVTYILESFEGSAECLEALQDSQSAGQRILRMLTNLVEVARLDAATLPLRRTGTSISTLVRAIADAVGADELAVVGDVLGIGAVGHDAGH